MWPTLLPVLTQSDWWVIFSGGGLIGVLTGILRTWHYTRLRRSTLSVPFVPPYAPGPGLGSKPPKPSSSASGPFDAPLPPRWKNGRRLPQGTGNLGRKLLNESSISYEGENSGKGCVDLQGLGEAMKRQLNRKRPSAWR